MHRLSIVNSKHWIGELEGKLTDSCKLVNQLTEQVEMLHGEKEELEGQLDAWQDYDVNHAGAQSLQDSWWDDGEGNQENERPPPGEGQLRIASASPATRTTTLTTGGVSGGGPGDDDSQGGAGRNRFLVTIGDL